MSGDGGDPLNVFSPDFDPLKAIYDERTVVDGSAPVMDNVEKFVSVMENKRTTKPEEKPSTSREEPLQRQFKPEQMPVKAPTKKLPNLFNYMANVKGPMAMLKRIVDEKLRAKVYIRGIDSMRGICVGYIVAFDKHWNMALVDVDETFKRRRFPKTPPSIEDSMSKMNLADSSERERIGESVLRVIKTTRRWETCERHVHQILLRGEHVSHIAIV